MVWETKSFPSGIHTVMTFALKKQKSWQDFDLGGDFVDTKKRHSNICYA